MKLSPDDVFRVFWTRWIEKFSQFYCKMREFFDLQGHKMWRKVVWRQFVARVLKDRWHLKCCLFCICCYKKGGICDAMGLKDHIKFVCRMRKIEKMTHLCVKRRCPFFFQKKVRMYLRSKYFNLFLGKKKDRQRAKLFVCQERSSWPSPKEK